MKGKMPEGGEDLGSVLLWGLFPSPLLSLWGAEPKTLAFPYYLPPTLHGHGAEKVEDGRRVQEGGQGKPS